jgi:acetylornithine deacetylase/succinyl-diaminopimelate desuccinylase-like protein
MKASKKTFGKKSSVPAPSPITAKETSLPTADFLTSDFAYPPNALANQLYELAAQEWDEFGIDGLIGAVAIDSLSVNFNPDWFSDGKLREILDYLSAYTDDQLSGTTSTFFEDDFAPPCLLLKVPGTSLDADSKSIMLYTHADTQPHAGTEWTYQVDPTKAARITTDSTDFLYGRRTTDNKHGVITSVAAVAAIKALMAAGKTFPTIYIFIETGEESGSPNLTNYLKLAAAEMGSPSAAVFVLDASGPSWTHLFNVRTIRGFIDGKFLLLVKIKR